MDQLNPTQSQSDPVDPMDQFSKEPVQQVPPVPPVSETPQQPESAATPQIQSQAQVPEVEVPEVPRRSKGPLIVLLSLFVVLILLIGTGAFFALVAYGKVDINNKELERKISFAVQALPFTPKTAEYLIYQSFDAQKNLKSMYIDTSIALKGSEATAIPGLGSNFDLVIKGPVDFYDKENPKAEINIKMTPELDADFVTVNDKIFFRINEIPALVKGLADGAGFSFDPFMAKWIFYDLKSLESDARDALNEDKGVRDEEQLEKVKTAILNSEAIKKIVVTETALEGNPVYQMSLEMTSEEYMRFVNDIARAINPEAYSNQLVTGTEASQNFENLKITTYLDKESMHTVKSMISFRVYTSDLNVPSQVLGASTIQYFPNVYTAAANPKDEYMDIAVVVNGSRFNEEFEVKEPEGAIPLETVIEEYTRQMMQKYQQDSMKDYGDDSSGFDGFEDSGLSDDEDTGISPY